MSAATIAWHRLDADQHAALMAVVEAESIRAWVAGWDAAEREYFGTFPAPTDAEHRTLWRSVARRHRAVTP